MQPFTASPSTAPSPSRKWQPSTACKFPLLSDFNKEVSDAYDVLYADLLGFKRVSKRSAFVVDETVPSSTQNRPTTRTICPTSMRSRHLSRPKRTGTVLLAHLPVFNAHSGHMS